MCYDVNNIIILLVLHMYVFETSLFSGYLVMTVTTVIIIILLALKTISKDYLYTYIRMYVVHSIQKIV